MLVCFCKQKTAYEMRISDWSSDVCSSDLPGLQGAPFLLVQAREGFSLEGDVDQVARRVVGPAVVAARESLRVAGIRAADAHAAVAALVQEYSDAAVLLPHEPDGVRSEERRLGKEWAGQGKSRWTQFH